MADDFPVIWAKSYRHAIYHCIVQKVRDADDAEAILGHAYRRAAPRSASFIRASAIAINLVRNFFPTIWERDCRDRVDCFIRQRVGNRHDAEELFQDTYFRAARKWKDFRGDSKPYTWVQVIAHRLIINHYRDRARRPKHLGDGDEQVQAPAENAGGDELGTRPLIEKAVRTGHITAREAAMLKARLDHPKPSWAEIAEATGEPKEAAAQRHCRGKRKFTVYLFVHHPIEADQRAAILAAMDRARQAPTDPLIETEAEIFRQVVLDRAVSPSKRGIGKKLTQACMKVAKELAEGWVDL